MIQKSEIKEKGGSRIQEPGRETQRKKEEKS